MKKQSGANNIKGINFQILAAFALFLQYLKNSEFSYIHLETPNSNDFDLVFKDGHKIICEAKNYSNNIQDSHIRQIISKFASAKKIYKEDEILVICKNYKTETFKQVRYLKYNPEKFKDVFRKKGYPAKLIRYLEKVKVWKSNEKNLKSIIYMLLYELIGFWLPDFNVEKIVNDIAYKVFIEGSSVGMIYKRDDIIQEIKSLAKEKQQESDIFNDEFNSVNEQAKGIISTIEANNPIRGFANISSLTQKPSLMYLLLDRLKKKANLILKDWDLILKASNIGIYSFKLYELFKSNLKNDLNRSYILDYLLSEGKKFNTFYRESFFERNISFVLDEIVKIDEGCCEIAFQIIESQFSFYGKDLFYIEPKDNQLHKKVYLCKTLKIIFEKSSSRNKVKIIRFIFSYFNLIEDNDEHNHYTPIELFELINNYLVSDTKSLEKKFFIYTKVLSKQFDMFEKFFIKKDFDGWDKIGSFSVFSGNNYKVSDKCFIKKSLTRVLYGIDTKIRWEFVKKHCIFSDQDVKKNNPDFLRRAAIPIILDEFKKNNKEIPDILKQFIFSKGIPAKVSLIYQGIYLGDFSEEQKLQVVEISLKKTNMPISPFVEMIISDLAKNGNERAQEILEGWLNNDKYLSTHFHINKGNIVENLKKLFESSQKKAIPIIKNLFLDNNFINNIDDFDINEYCNLLSEILKSNFDIGLEIINDIYRQETLNRNQQILITDSFNEIVGQKDVVSEDQKIIVEIYEKFLKPVLLELETNANIESKFNYRHSREAIVKFSERLAIIGKFDEALFIVEKLINDSDPPENYENYPDDSNGDFNYHVKIKNGEEIITINTVRGWIPWVLQKFINLKGQNYIEKIIPLIYKLLKDRNYYTRVQALVPFIELVKRRNDYLEDRKERFLGIKTAEVIENIAFELLDNKENQKIVSFMKYLGKVFSHIRSLNEEKALHVLNAFLNLKNKICVDPKIIQINEAYEDIIQDIGIIFIFFAEFRKDAFSDEKYKNTYLDNWKVLQKFEDKPFKDLLISLLEKSTPGIRSSFAYQFSNNLPNSYFFISYKYLKVLTKNYDNNVYMYVYNFIEENISKEFDASFDLYTSCLLQEREFIKKNINGENQSEMYWWPYFYNGKMLEIIFEKKGENEFLKWFDFLLDYPKELPIAYDLDIAVKILKSLQHNTTKKNDIINKLIERYPAKYYDL